jgi:hypothetical protein
MSGPLHSEAQGPTSGRRLALAEWLTEPGSAASGLVARVQVNRVWQRLFGRGIVATADNFGRSGSRPTHPELLDRLADEFIRHGWRLKPIVREIMISTAYRQSSQPAANRAEHAQEVDPEDLLLWHMPLRRLESEVVRDSVLAVSGQLNPKLGGAAIVTEARADGMVVVDAKRVASPGDALRRSLYLLARRNYNLSFLSVFDQPVMTGNCTRRSTSTVVLQSLSMLNDAFVLEQADHFAARVAREAGGADAATIDRAFRLALAREPGPAEIDWSADLLARHQARYEASGVSGDEARHRALAHLCQMLLNTNEFLYVE